MRRETSPQKWDVWLVITAQGWAVPGESTGVVLLTPPCPLLPFCLLSSPFPLHHCCLTIHVALCSTHPPHFSSSDPLCNLQLPTQSLIMASHDTGHCSSSCSQLYLSTSDTHSQACKHKHHRRCAQGKNTGAFSCAHISWEMGLFSSLSSKFPHHVTLIPSSSADCKLDRSINYLTTHNNPVAFRFILPTAFKRIYVFHPVSLTTSVLLY